MEETCGVTEKRGLCHPAKSKILEDLFRRTGPKEVMNLLLETLPEARGPGGNIPASSFPFLSQSHSSASSPSGPTLPTAPETLRRSATCTMEQRGGKIGKSRNGPQSKESSITFYINLTY